MFPKSLTIFLKGGKVIFASLFPCFFTLQHPTSHFYIVAIIF